MVTYSWTTTLRELWLGSSGSIYDWATQRQNYKDQMTQNNNAWLVWEMEADSDTFLNQSLSATDAATSKKNAAACNLNDLAVAMDKRRFQNRWVHIDKKKYPTASAIAQQWIRTFPNDETHVNNCINWMTDLPTTLQRLGITFTEEDKRRVEPAVQTKEKSSWWGSTLANVTQAIIDVPMDLAKLPFNLIDKWTAWVAKQFSDNDEAINEKLEENLQKTENFATLPWVDREDASYWVPNLVTDLWTTVATSFIPWVWEAKWTEFATKYPKFAKLIKLAWGADEVYKKYPWIAKFLKWWATWVKDITVMNALEWEWTTPLEAIEWRLAWWIIEKWAWALKKLSAYIQTNWLLKPTDAENIIRKLKSRWELWGKLRDITRLADFMTENWLVWTKQQVYEKAMKLWSDKRKILMDLIEIADKSDLEKWITHSLSEADEAIDLLKQLLEKSDGSPVIPRKEQLQFFNEMIAKRWIGAKNWMFSNVGKYSLSDLQRLKNELDDLYKIYDDAWSVLERQQAGYWHEERKAIKEYIEKEMKKRWMWDVSQINNEISTAYEIANWVSDKVLSDSAKSAMSSVANTISDWAWPAAWLYLWGSAINDFRKWDVGWWLVKIAWIYMLNNTYIKTHLWSFLNRLTWTSRSEVQKWIDSEWRAALSNEASEEVAKIINSDSSLKKRVLEVIKQYLTNVPKDAATIWWQKVIEEWVDSMME